jgi:hypothetical protein
LSYLLTHLPSNLVAEALAGDDGNILSDTLVGVEVESQTSVVLLDNKAGSLLDSLGTNATPEKIVKIYNIERVTRK